MGKNDETINGWKIKTIQRMLGKAKRGENPVEDLAANPYLAITEDIHKDTEYEKNHFFGLFKKKRINDIPIENAWMDGARSDNIDDKKSEWEDKYDTSKYLPGMEPGNE